MAVRCLEVRLHVSVRPQVIPEFLPLYPSCGHIAVFAEIIPLIIDKRPVIHRIGTIRIEPAPAGLILHPLDVYKRQLLKRARIATDRRIICGKTTLDYDALTVTVDGEETLLPQKEFYLLYKLMSYPNKIFTRQQLMDEIWGMDSTSDERTVDVHINRLRERFRDCDDFLIMTVRGLGYKVVKAEL